MRSIRIDDISLVNERTTPCGAIFRSASTKACTFSFTLSESSCLFLLILIIAEVLPSNRIFCSSNLKRSVIIATSDSRIVAPLGLAPTTILAKDSMLLLWPSKRIRNSFSSVSILPLGILIFCRLT